MRPQRLFAFWAGAAVKANGGEVLVGPLPTPDGQTFAWFLDPDAVRLALISK